MPKGYIERGPLSLEKLSVSDFAKATSGRRPEHEGPRRSFSEGGQDDIVSYNTKDGVTHEFDALDFLALMTSHIPSKWESLTRYYGYYSNRARGERAGLSEPNKTLSDLPELTSQPSKTWAACIKRTFELNPLECPKCKSEMRIVAFLSDTREINKIMENLKIPNVMPKTISRAPPELEQLHTQNTFND